MQSLSVPLLVGPESLELLIKARQAYALVEIYLKSLLWVISRLSIKGSKQDKLRYSVMLVAAKMAARHEAVYRKMKQWPQTVVLCGDTNQRHKPDSSGEHTPGAAPRYPPPSSTLQRQDAITLMLSV